MLKNIHINMEYTIYIKIENSYFQLYYYRTILLFHFICD